MRTIADVAIRPNTRRETWVRDALLILAGSLFVALCAKIQIVSGPIPRTMQSFGVILVAASLGSRRATAAMALYLTEGLVGLPVFAFPITGVAYFAGPTAGFLLSFLPAAYVVGALTERGWDRRFPTALVAILLGNALILVIGFSWAAAQLGVDSAFARGFLSSLALWDALKVLLTAAALPLAWKLVSRLERGDDASQ